MPALGLGYDFLMEDEGPVSSVKQFASDVMLLVRKELDSARSEMAGKAKAAGVGAGMLSGSAVAGLFTLASLTALALIALSLVIPLWASALVMTVVWAAITATLAVAGKKKVDDAIPFLPEQTIQSVKEDVEWAQRGRNPLGR
ncbi:MAG: phage holin family protein [Candidatus Eremiobacteraeota bacterium]|nr:phage holin family protein [Candidatus Eremiobacteraeota bacterium]